jgi:hypothetical protein
VSKIPRRGPLDDSVKLGIPNVTTDPESLRRATEALTRAIEELARQRGDVGRSAVRVNDLIKLGIISPDIVHTLDPGGAKYLQRGPAGMDPQQPPGMGPGGPGEPVEPPGPPNWNEIINLPDCFPPCGHDHTWDEITTLPECFPPCDHTHPWDDITEVPDLGQPIEDDAVYQFFLADSMPYKQFEYDAGLLDTINLYDDAGLTNLRYSKQLVRTGDKLTSIVLTRYPDEAQWTKTLSYNLDDALETVATEAA